MRTGKKSGGEAVFAKQNTDQLWFEGKKTGFFRLKNARFLPLKNDPWTDDIGEFLIKDWKR